MHGDVESSHGGAHPPREAPKILLPCRNEASSQPLATSCEGDPSASRMETGRSAHLVSHWFATRPRLIVWDFDRTILRTHAFGEGVEVAQVAHRWQSDMCDAALFRAFVETAQAQGVDIGIASYGRRDVIHEYMRHVFAGAETAPFGVETNIITPQLLGEPDGTAVPHGKPKMLELLCERASPAISDKGAVLFFDDDPENIADCRRAGFPQAFCVPEGFSRLSLSALQTTAEATEAIGAAEAMAAATTAVAAEASEAVVAAEATHPPACTII